MLFVKDLAVTVTKVNWKYTNRKPVLEKSNIYVFYI